MWMAGKELAKISLISALRCQLSETPEMSDTIQTGNLWNGKSFEIDHQVVKRRWVVIPKVLVVKGLWGKEGHWEWDALEDAVGSRACGCPGPCCPSGPARARPELSALRPPLLEKKPSSGNIKGVRKEVSIQTGCFPEVSLKAWLRLVWRLPHFLLAWWKLLSWFLELALWKYTPFLSIHLYIASFCKNTSQSQAVSGWLQLNVALKSEAEGSLPEWVGRQPNRHPVCTGCHNLHSGVAGKHCGSLGFSVCHNVYTFGATAGMPWVSPGGAVHDSSTGYPCATAGISFQLCGWEHTLVQETQVWSWSFRHLSWFLICSCKGTGLLFR